VTTLQMVRYIYPAESSQGKWIWIANSDNSKGWKSDGYLRAKDCYLPQIRKYQHITYFLKQQKLKIHFLD
jgi:hypothetical protein